MEVRSDTYLWAIRLFKTRSMATDAIKGGKVKLNGDAFKPSHKVKCGEVYILSTEENRKIIEVKELTDKRKSFEFASQHYTDLSPEPEKKEKLNSSVLKMNIKREKGEGRPTKKDRRAMNDLDFF